jgi:predicted glycosyltransferase
MTSPDARRKIWIDLDNSPHVPFFIPIKRELEQRGHAVMITTRDCFQTCALAEFHHLPHRAIGKHYGASKTLKVAGTMWRALQLMPTALRERPDVSLSHGSRALILVSWLLRIPTILFFDYEHARMLPLARPDVGMAPAILETSRIRTRFKSGLHVYQGLKEDVYIPSFTPDASIRGKLGLPGDAVVVTVRPPATEAHYHRPAGDQLFVETVEFLAGHPQVRMVILPRNDKTERARLQRLWPELCERRTIIIPAEPLNGLDLIWHSDLVISGGGTMNREAAALGVPVYSIFGGEIGAVDRYLADTGRLTLIETVQDVRTKIRPVKRPVPKSRRAGDNRALTEIMGLLDRWLQAPPGRDGGGSA